MNCGRKPRRPDFGKGVVYLPRDLRGLENFRIPARKRLDVQLTYGDGRNLRVRPGGTVWMDGLTLFSFIYGNTK